MLIGIRDAPVVLFAEFVVGCVRVGISAKPELLDEGVTLFVVAQVLEGLPFLIGNDVRDVLVEPGLVGTLQLLTDSLLRLEGLTVAAGPFEGVDFLIARGAAPSVSRHMSTTGG